MPPAVGPLGGSELIYIYIYGIGILLTIMAIFIVI